MDKDFGDDIEILDFDPETNEEEVANEEEAIVEELTEDETEEVEGGASVSRTIRKSSHSYGRSLTFRNLAINGVYNCGISGNATISIGRSTVTITKKRANFKGTVTGNVITKQGRARVRYLFTVQFR